MKRQFTVSIFILLAAFVRLGPAVQADEEHSVNTALSSTTLTGYVDTSPFAVAASLPAPARPTTFPLTRPQGVGNVVAWGLNNYGQTQAPAAIQGRTVAVSAGGYHSLALLNDGTVAPWGWNNFGQNNVPPGLNDVVAIADGNSHTMALRANGQVVCWGDPNNGRTTVPAGLSEVVAISTAGGHSMALKRDGTVVAWGWNPYGQTAVPPILSDVVAIAAGFGHSVALKGNGTVAAWGWNNNGQATVPLDLTGVVAIAAGGTDAAGSHTLALKSNGTVVAWGSNSYGQSTVPANLNNVVAITAGYLTSFALKADGTVVSWGDTRNDQRAIPDSRFVSIASKGFHTVALEAVPRRAVATAQIVNGFIVGLNLIDGGFGYTGEPVVIISGGNGSGATARAYVENGSVVAFSVINAGSGYTAQPTIQIASPPFAPFLEIEFSRVKVTTHVVLGQRYQLRASQDLTTWTNVGEPFVAASEEMEQEFVIETTGRYYTIVEAPL